MIKLSPSILAADFSRLGEEIKSLEKEKVPYLHVDVMDGHFVPNISVGTPVVECIRKFTDMILDVHLMIENPEKFIGVFAEAGADIINVHFEASENISNTIKLIKSYNKKAAVTLKPKTPFSCVKDILPEIDMLLIMCVEPGFGGQELIESSYKKIKEAYNFIESNQLKTDIEVDGGINFENIGKIIECGANVIVAGTSVFGAENISLAVEKFNCIFNEYEVKK